MTPSPPSVFSHLAERSDRSAVLSPGRVWHAGLMPVEQLADTQPISSLPGTRNNDVHTAWLKSSCSWLRIQPAVASLCGGSWFGTASESMPVVRHEPGTQSFRVDSQWTVGERWGSQGTSQGQQLGGINILYKNQQQPSFKA